MLQVLISNPQDSLVGWHWSGPVQVRPRSAAMLYIQNLELVNGKEETPQPSVQDREKQGPVRAILPITFARWFEPCFQSMAVNSA